MQRSLQSKIRKIRRDLCEDTGSRSSSESSSEDEDHSEEDEDQMDVDPGILGSTSRSQVDGRCDEDLWKIDPVIKIEFISSEKIQGLDPGSCSVELSEDFHRKVNFSKNRVFELSRFSYF